MNLRKLLVAGVVGVCLALIGCSSTSGVKEVQAAAPAPAEKMDKARFDTVYAEAEAARKKAASVGMEWRDIGKFRKTAKKAAADGDYETAIKLAEKAKKQGELGYQQAMAQSEVRVPSVLSQ